MAESNYIGRMIRELRKEKGFTLKEFADLASLSASYISQVENDKSSPSINSLRSIAQVLGVKAADFFADELVDDSPILPPKLWTKVLLPGWEAEVNQMAHIVDDKRMQPFHTTVPPGSGTRENYSHPGEEFGYVLDGELTLKLGEEAYELEKGWAVYYSSLIPHSWRNHGQKPCNLMWVVSPPSW